MGETSIAWCDYTFNPWEGCTKISPGCKHCYAEQRALRFGSVEWGPGKPRRRTSPANWRKPLAWNESAFINAASWRPDPPPRPRVFCASLADVFDPEVPHEWRGDLFALIEKTPHLDWLLLTKRPEHFNDMAVSRGWPSNVWLGVTVENQEQAERRIPLLLAQDAAVRFLSCEPLLEEVRLRPTWHRGVFGGAAIPGIDWCIIGGESGAHARPFDLAWARSLMTQCRAAGVAPFMKQLGAKPIEDLPAPLTAPSWQGLKSAHVLLNDRAGADPSEWPPDLCVREFPEVRRG